MGCPSRAAAAGGKLGDKAGARASPEPATSRDCDRSGSSSFRSRRTNSRVGGGSVCRGCTRTQPGTFHEGGGLPGLPSSGAWTPGNFRGETEDGSAPAPVLTSIPAAPGLARSGSPGNTDPERSRQRERGTRWALSPSRAGGASPPASRSDLAIPTRAPPPHGTGSRRRRASRRPGAERVAERSGSILHPHLRHYRCAIGVDDGRAPPRRGRERVAAPQARVLVGTCRWLRTRPQTAAVRTRRPSHRPDTTLGARRCPGRARDADRCVSHG